MKAELRTRERKCVRWILFAAILLCASCASTQAIPGAAQAGAAGGSADCSSDVVAVFSERHNPIPERVVRQILAGVGGRWADAEIHIGTDVTQPRLNNQRVVQRELVRRYPPDLRDTGRGGTTILYFLIDENGRVSTTLLRRTSGHAQLDMVSAAIARVMEFTPAIHRGCDRATVVEIPIVWTSQ